jgi:hypothetical protein
MSAWTHETVNDAINAVANGLATVFLSMAGLNK